MAWTLIRLENENVAIVDTSRIRAPTCVPCLGRSGRSSLMHPHTACLSQRHDGYDSCNYAPERCRGAASTCRGIQLASDDGAKGAPWSGVGKKEWSIC